MGLLLAILGLASSAWGDTQQKNQLERLKEEMEGASADVKAGVKAGYKRAKGDILSGYHGAEVALKRGFKKAQEQLEAGNEEASIQILKGLGLSTEEINKWADVAAEGMEWVVDFGKEGQIPARAYAAEMAEVIMNPDAILGSEVYLKYKTEVMDSMKNAFSASPGLMSGNTFAAMADRLGKDALTVQQNYIANLNVGRQNAMQQVGLGADASKFISNLNQARGVNLANLTTGAYNQLGMNERDLGTALANLETGKGTGLANLATGRGTTLANLGVGRTQDIANLDLGLATQLANIQLASMQENPWTNLGTTATTLGGQEIQQGNLLKFGKDRTNYLADTGGDTSTVSNVREDWRDPLKAVALTANQDQLDASTVSPASAYLGNLSPYRSAYS
jgi:hypothetical protein